MKKKATKKRAAKKKVAAKAAPKKRATKKKTSRKGIGGRPKFQIDYTTAERLSQIQCTIEEIAQILGCSSRTLERDAEFCRRHKKALESGKASLRRLQWKAAQAGQPTMLVWLGKQYLGQTDRMDHSTKGEQIPGGGVTVYIPDNGRSNAGS